MYRRPPWTLGAGLLWLVALTAGGILAWLDYRSHPPPPAMPQGEFIEFEVEGGFVEFEVGEPETSE